MTKNQKEDDTNDINDIFINDWQGHGINVLTKKFFVVFDLQLNNYMWKMSTMAVSLNEVLLSFHD